MKHRIGLFFFFVGLAFRELFHAKPAGSGCQFANVGEGSHESGIKSFKPDATGTARYLCYKIGATADTIAVCGAGEVPLGSSDDVADDTAIPIAVNLFGVRPGTVRITAGGTVANGDHVKSDASGKAVTASSTDVSFGIALVGTDQTAASGDVIEVIHCVPHKYVF